MNANTIVFQQPCQPSVRSLDGLIAHSHTPSHTAEAVEAAFGDLDCLKMVLDWRH